MIARPVFAGLHAFVSGGNADGDPGQGQSGTPAPSHRVAAWLRRQVPKRQGGQPHATLANPTVKQRENGTSCGNAGTPSASTAVVGNTRDAARLRHDPSVRWPLS